jgi:replicative DNA helicase
MVTKASPSTNDNTSDQWQVLADAQAALINGIRRHERGDSIQPAEVMNAAMSLLEKTQMAAQVITDVSMLDLLADYWTQVEKRKHCSPTGFGTLNDVLGGGLESKRLVVVLGAPNSGKTTWIHQVADHVADGGRPVLYVTSEDSPHDLMCKTLSRIGKVNYTAVKKGWDSERARITQTLATQAGRQSTRYLRYVDATSGVSLEIIKEKAQVHFAEQPGQGVLIVDYLQRLARAMRLAGSSPMELREAVTSLTEQLRAMACELDCCVVAVASQNRGGYNGSNSMSSAKESGDVEYTSDVILALGDDTDRKAINSSTKSIKLQVVKNRQGDRDRCISFDFQPDIQMFTEAAG